MKIADLFLNLGLNGQGEVSKGLKGISGSLKDLFSMSIQTKLTLAGIASGLTAAAFSAGKTGMSLKQFANSFGLSTREMQLWEMAGRQFGVSAEEVRGSVEGIQDALIEAKAGRGFNEAFSLLGIDPRSSKDAFDVLEKLRQRVKDGQVDAMRLFSSGLIDKNMFQFLRQTGDPLKMKPIAPILSKGQIDQLARVSVSFSNFSENLKRSMENFIVKNEPLINGLIKSIGELLESLLKWIGKGEDKTGLIADVVKGENIPVAVTKAAGRGFLSVGDKINEAVVEGGKALWETFKAGAAEIEYNNRPPPSIQPNLSKRDTGWIEYQQGNTSTYVFNDVKVDDKMSDGWKKETQNVFRQLVGAK